MGTKVNSNYSDLLTFTRASKGHALRPVSYGDELVTNGDTFSSGWTTTGWTFSSEQASVTGNGTNQNLYGTPVSNAVAGKLYQLSYEVISSSLSGGALRAGAFSGASFFGGSYFTLNTTVGTHVLSFVGSPSGAGSVLDFWLTSGATSGTLVIDNVSIKEVTFDQPNAPLTLFEHPTNIPRVEYDADGNRLGLLVEEARTNSLTYSEDFTQSFYIKDANVTVTSSNNAAPSGALNASLITASDNGRIYANTASLTGVISVFVKAGTFTNLKIKSNNVDLVAKTASAGTLTEVGGGWFRYTSEEATASRHFQIQAYPDDTYSSHTTTGTYYIWGAQVEAGSFPTSYIKSNSGSTTTRSADVASIPVADFGYNQSAGSLVVEADSALVSTNRLFSFHDASLNLDNAIYGYSGSNNHLILRAGAVTEAAIDAGTITENTPYKLAGAYKENNAAASLDGGAAVSDTSCALPVNLTNLFIGSYAGNSTYLNGHIKSIKYYPRRLSNAQLVQLTS